MKNKYAVLVAAGLILLVTACGGSDAQSGGEPAIAAPRQITSSDQIVLPLSSYVPTLSQQKTIVDAAQELAVQCAKNYDVDFTPQHIDVISAVATERRYGVVNKKEVVRYGYNMPPSRSSIVDEKSANTLSSRDTMVMYGTNVPAGFKGRDGSPLPQGGCLQKGSDILGTAENSAEDQTNTLLSQAWDETKADSRALAAQDAWAKCMTRWGYSFQHRWDAGNSVKSSPSRQQITMAERDLECADKVNYVGIWYAVDSAYQNQLIAENISQLQGAEDSWQAELVHARNILNG